MKYFRIVCLLLLGNGSSHYAYSQNNIANSTTKEIGLNFDDNLELKLFIGINSLFYLSNSFTGDTLSAQEMVVGKGASLVYHYKYFPALSYEMGLSALYYLNHHKFFMETGLKFVNRNESAKKTDASYTDPGYENVQKSIYQLHNLEIPFAIGISIHDLNASFGFSFSLLGITNRKFILNDKSKTQVNQSFIFLNDENPCIFPLLTLDYNLLIGKMALCPYLSIDFATKSYLHLGLGLKLNQKKHLK